MFFQLPLCISSDDTHHTMIGTFSLYAPVVSNIQNPATILILDLAFFFYISTSFPTVGHALDKAFSQYKSSDTHNAVKEQFVLPPNQYSILQFTEFVLSHRLQR
jgi:hypothetical protein